MKNKEDNNKCRSIYLEAALMPAMVVIETRKSKTGTPTILATGVTGNGSVYESCRDTLTVTGTV